MTKKLSRISLLHYIKLGARSVLFLAAVLVYFLDRAHALPHRTVLNMVIWIAFFIEMLLRFFPSRLESMGCQKQFARNFEPTEATTAPTKSVRLTTFLAALSWIVLNGIIGALYLCGIFDRGILILIALFFSVCDIICILFFCPFQSWIMKNRCCTTCRIYNWDFAMMFTPLVFLPSLYTYSLLGCAFLLLFRWELTYYRHPERFFGKTNRCLDCARCEEKLCQHKKQLQGFLKKRAAKRAARAKTK